MYFDVELERNLLGALSYSNELIQDLKVKPMHMYNNKNKVCLEAIYKLYNEGKDINYVTLGEELKGKWTITELVQLDDNGSLYMGSFNSIQDKLISLYTKSITEKALINSMQLLSDGEDPEKVLTGLNEQLIKEVKPAGNTITHMGDLIEKTLVETEKVYSNGGEITGMVTNFNKLDNMLNGIERGKYIVIAARPGIGKSAMSIELSKRLSENNKVLFFSLEMTGEEISKRLLSNTSKIPMMNVKRGKLKEESFYKLIEVSGALQRLNLWVDPTEGLTIEELERRARRFQRKNGLDVIVIDYLTLLHSEMKFSIVRDKVNYISERIRQLAKSLNVAIITLSQLNRRVDGTSDKKPLISDLRESGNIEQDAHVILLLQEEANENPISPDRLNVDIAKNRGGAKGIIIFNYYKSTQIIDEA